MPITSPPEPEGWITATLQNSWVAAGGTSAVPRFRRFGRRVYLDGAANTGTSGTVAFTLPVGYRPTTDKFPIMLTSGGVGFVTVLTSGTVSLTQLTGSASTGSFFDGVSFEV